VRPPLANDEIAKSAVRRDQDPALRVRRCKDDWIGQARGMLARHAGHVVPEAAEVCDESCVRALVEQEPHPDAM